jgi:ketosteroid isomerase-like protein
MSAEEFPAGLTRLLDQQAIYEIVARYCSGIDRQDAQVLRSVFHSDALVDYGMFVGGREEFVKFAIDLESVLKSAGQHLIMNHLVQIDGDVAHAETYWVSHGMYLHGDPYQSLGGRYIDRLEKRSGVWAIVIRKCVFDWVAPSTSPASQDASGMQGIQPWQLEAARHGPVSARNRSDASYERPLRIAPERLTECARLKSDSVGNSPSAG